MGLIEWMKGKFGSKKQDSQSAQGLQKKDNSKAGTGNENTVSPKKKSSRFPSIPNPFKKKSKQDAINSQDASKLLSKPSTSNQNTPDKKGWFSKAVDSLRGRRTGKPKLQTPTQEKQEPKKRTTNVDFAKGIEDYENLLQQFAEFMGKGNKHAFVADYSKLQKDLTAMDAVYEVDTLDETGVTDPLEMNFIGKVRQTHYMYDKLEEVITSTHEAKEGFIEQAAQNPELYAMVMHVSKKNKEAKDAAVGKATAAYDQATDAEKAGKSKDEWVDEKAWSILNRAESGSGEAIEAPKESRVDKAKGILEFIKDFIVNVIGNIGDIKDTSDAINDKAELIKKLQGNEWKKGEAPDGFAYASAVGTLLNTIFFILKCVETHNARSSAYESGDAQEKSDSNWEVFDRVAESIGLLLDGASAFLGFVPFLGTACALLQNTFGIIQASRDIHKARTRKGVAKESMKRLAEAMKAKRQKYGNMEDAKYFELSDKLTPFELRRKKNELMEMERSELGVEKEYIEEDMSDPREHGAVARFINNADTFLHKKEDTEMWDQGLSGINIRLQSKMAQLHKEREEKRKTSSLSYAQEREYKKRMHRLEAIQMITDYETQQAAEHKNNVTLAHSGEDLTKEIIKTLSNITQGIGEIAIFTGVGAAGGAGAVATARTAKAVVGVYDTTASVARFAHGKMMDYTQRNANKNFQRNQMAVSLCERMGAMGNLFTEQGLGDQFPSTKKIPDEVRDTTIRHMAKEFDFVLGVRKSTNMKISAIREANGRAEIVGSLTKIFSQDGN